MLAIAAAASLAVFAVAPVGPANASTETFIDLQSFFNDHYAKACGSGCDVVEVPKIESQFRFTGANGKYEEIQDANSGLCLEFVSSGSTLYVREATCQGLARQLWWLVEEGSTDYYQVINDYGTTLLGHDACMWNSAALTTDSGADITVVPCVSDQPGRQQWAFAYAGSVGVA
jgi:hypothetical protein